MSQEAPQPPRRSTRQPTLSPAEEALRAHEHELNYAERLREKDRQASIELANERKRRAAEAALAELPKGWAIDHERRFPHKSDDLDTEEHCARAARYEKAKLKRESEEADRYREVLGKKVPAGVAAKAAAAKRKLEELKPKSKKKAAKAPGSEPEDRSVRRAERKLASQQRRLERARKWAQNARAGPAGRKVPVSEEDSPSESDTESEAGSEPEAEKPKKKARPASKKKAAAKPAAKKKPAAKAKPAKTLKNVPAGSIITSSGQVITPDEQRRVAEQRAFEEAGGDLIRASQHLIAQADEFIARVEAERTRLGNRNPQLPEWFKIIVRRDKAIKNPKGESTDLEYAATGRKSLEYLSTAAFFPNKTWGP